MTDRELLEFAAKAAGYVVHKHGNGGIWLSLASFLDGCGPRFFWRPINDGADALNLAVKLGICIRPEPDAICAGWNEWQSGAPTHDGQGPWFWKEWIKDGANKYDATCRAIVRAAAEIGKAMP